MRWNTFVPLNSVWLVQKERSALEATVYAHAKRKTLVVVKTGYCWAALVFGPLWFLLNKMWANALIFIALIVGNSLYVAHAAPVDAMDVWIYDVMTLLYPIAWFLFSLFANRLLCADLESKGYVLHTTTMARSPAYARDAARKATGDSRESDAHGSACMGHSLTN